MNAGIEELQCDGGVEGVGRGDDGGVDIVGGQRRGGRRSGGVKTAGERPSLLLAAVDEQARLQLQLFEGGNDTELGHRTAADDREAGPPAAGVAAIANITRGLRTRLQKRKQAEAPSGEMSRKQRHRRPRSHDVLLAGPSGASLMQLYRVQLRAEVALLWHCGI